MGSKAVTYNLCDGVATIRIDDGKRNALSPQLLDEIYTAFDQAESDRATVILTGRDEVFSAGFDLKIMKRGGMSALRMLRSGYALTARVLAYPRPVIAACNGHAMAMGVFLMLSADYVIGSRGDFRISANEVAIGMTMPDFAPTVIVTATPGDPSALSTAAAHRPLVAVQVSSWVPAPDARATQKSWSAGAGSARSPSPCRR